MKKILHDFLYKYFPRIWFLVKYRVENEYQDFIFSKMECFPFSNTGKKVEALAPVFKKIVRNRTFLEIGCDTGFFPLHASMLGATSAVGVDRNKKALGKATQARIKIGLDNVIFKHATIPDIGIKDTFDTVLLMSAIHYMFSDKHGNDLLFTTMDSFIEYLSQFVDQYLLIEFVFPNDPAARELVAERVIHAGEYGEEPFLKSLEARYASVIDLGTTHYETRKLYLAQKGGGV